MHFIDIDICVLIHMCPTHRDLRYIIIVTLSVSLSLSHSLSRTVHVTEGLVSVQSQMGKTKNDIELVQEAILSIVSAATKHEISREKKDIEMQKELNNISQSIDALRRGKSHMNGPGGGIGAGMGMGAGVSFLGAIQKESSGESPKSENLSNFTTDFSMQKSLDTKENLNSYLNESKISKEDLMDIFANVIANAKASSPGSGRDISGHKTKIRRRYNSRRSREYSSDYSNSAVEVEERGRVLLNRSEAVYHSDDQSDDYSVEASSSQNQQYKYNYNKTSTEEKALQRSQSGRNVGRDSIHLQKKTKSGSSRKPDGGERGRDRDHSDRNTDRDLTDGGDSHGSRDRERDSKVRSSIRKKESTHSLPRPASAVSPARSRNSSAERKGKQSSRGAEEDKSSQSPLKRREKEKEKAKIRHPAPLRGVRKRDTSTDSVRRSKGSVDRGPKLEFRSDVQDSPKRQGKYGRKTIKTGRDRSPHGQSRSPNRNSETDDSALAAQEDEVEEVEGMDGEEDEEESVRNSSVGEEDEDVEHDREGERDRGQGRGQSHGHVEDFYEANAQALQAARTASGSHLPVGYRKSLSYNSQGDQCTELCDTVL